MKQEKSLFLRVNYRQINQVTPKCQMYFLDKIWRKRSKAEHHQRILHIRNSVGIKFHLKVTILIFWTKLTQRGYLQSKKQNENHQRTLDTRISICSNFQL